MFSPLDPFYEFGEFQPDVVLGNLMDASLEGVLDLVAAGEVQRNISPDGKGPAQPFESIHQKVGCRFDLLETSYESQLLEFCSFYLEAHGSPAREKILEQGKPIFPTNSFDIFHGFR